MTLVGKLLVFVIMVFSVVALGATVVVFQTATNWKQATEAEKKKFADLQKKKADVDNTLKSAQSDLARAKDDAANAVKERENRIATLTADVARIQQQLTAVQGDLATAQQAANTALAEAGANRSETEKLRGHKLDVEKQANDYMLKQAELNDTIRVLTRELSVATKNVQGLRDTVARQSTVLRQHGISDDISQIKGLESPPAVSGEVARVQDNKFVELTIGSDDGLVAGHELFLYRVKPRPEYLGRIKILRVEPDKAVGAVIGTTIQGKKIKEGDIVSSTIRGGARS
jgi:hypothetical protein